MEEQPNPSESSRSRARHSLLEDEKRRLMQLLEDRLDGLLARMEALDPAAGAHHRDLQQQRPHGDSARDQLPRKEFRHRCSLLTELFELSHFRTLLHVFVALMSVYGLSALVCDALDGRSLVDTLSLPLLRWAFGRLPDAIAIWLGMHAAVLLVAYPMFHHFASPGDPGEGQPTRKAEASKSLAPWLALYVTFQVSMLLLPLRCLITSGLPPASALVVLVEQSRLLMKLHAFVWENAPYRVCPSFSRFLYFMFAPTLVYRDAYPLDRPTRWRYVASNLCQVAGCALFAHLLLVRYCLPVFGHWRSSPGLPHFVHTVFQSALPGGLVLLLGFFAVLHSWLNAFAEMLRFGDRQFYLDWWNVTSFRTWYRTWNTVVHDWLYTYVYRELYLRLGPAGRGPATGCVFLLSALCHEYILAFSLGFFFPALFAFFCGAGLALMFANGRSRFWAVFVWANLFLGMGALMCLYSMEWFARRNCPSAYPDSPAWDFVVPRSFTCRV